MIKKTIVIAWRFKEAKFIEFKCHNVALFLTPANNSRYISNESFDDLLSYIDKVNQNLYIFIHIPNFSSAQLNIIQGKVNRNQNILVLGFSGGTSKVYENFIDQDNHYLTKLTDENIDKKLNECIHSHDILPKLIRIYKILVFQELNSTNFNLDRQFEILAEDDELEAAIDFLEYGPSTKFNEMLDRISGEVIK